MPKCNIVIGRHEMADAHRCKSLINDFCQIIHMMQALTGPLASYHAKMRHILVIQGPSSREPRFSSRTTSTSTTTTATTTPPTTTAMNATALYIGGGIHSSDDSKTARLSYYHLTTIFSASSILQGKKI